MHTQNRLSLRLPLELLGKALSKMIELLLSDTHPDGELSREMCLLLRAIADALLSTKDYFSRFGGFRAVLESLDALFVFVCQTRGTSNESNHKLYSSC